jgi:uncharacterized protein (DUF488 family)
MKLFTIGFTQKSAREFFELLERNGVKKIIDTRINNISQLAGFAKEKDLEYFAERILNISYEHKPLLAPTKDLLDRYRKHAFSWPDYEKEYLKLIEERQILKGLDIEQIDHACLLCSEHEPDHCHRRLLAEYLREEIPGLEIVHLK